jgi:Asp-tRNA(Asn)/Glu-tRNA(Gln) amidotransferase A subunit family amidase
LRWPTTIGVIPGYLDPATNEGGDGRFQRGVEDEVERERLRGMARARQEAEVSARREMLAAFESMGARVVEIEFPPDWETLTRSEFNNVRLPERSEPFLEHLRRDVRLFGVSLSPWINGLLLSGPEYLRGQRAKMLLLRRVLDDIFGKCDAVVQTSSIPFDMIGLPLITFPIGFQQSGGGPLPLGGLLGGLPFGEERLISLAAAYQAVTPWHRRRPRDPETTDAPGAREALAKRLGRRRLDVLDVMMECE